MIDIQSKIHDSNTIEFKVGYIPQPDMPESDFVMNTWIFMPDSLDINRRTFSKEMFYQNVHSHIRLITPAFTMSQLSVADNMPIQMLIRAVKRLEKFKNTKAMDKFESEVKMAASIFKSTLRDTYRMVISEGGHSDHCLIMVRGVEAWLKQYRSIYQSVIDLNDPTAKEYYEFADEFISNVTEQHMFLLCNYLKKEKHDTWDKVRTAILGLLDEELTYKKRMGYMHIQTRSTDNNSNFIHRAGMLKKFAESNLFLAVSKRRNTFLIEQLAFMLAAGLSMIFATVIAFSFQHTYGNFTRPLFIALVVSYMFKDRIKELIRFYFAHKLGSKFYDYKTSMSIHYLKLGWSKEGFDYITPDKLPTDVLLKRQRNTLLEISRGVNEQIILYRKKMHLNRKNVSKSSHYPMEGVNDIIRCNLFEFMRNMDDSDVPLFANDGNGEYSEVNGRRVYFINFVIQCKYQDITTEYYHYRVSISKHRIEDITAVP